MPKTVKVDIIENCNDCPYRADHHLYYDCTLCKDKRFDDDFPAIPAWCKLDSVQDITWDEWIAEVTAR